ncbi:NAD-dependent epimerase/dehydratase [Candidatus Nitrosopumilus koreensis AR1]|uniref:NAD-dependent epimerase/dehydratase n=1 Tax=Candidatus Nitrosopumilus koreensis AR1 TaxID=1229908 RepID=K0B4F7_9ARCH|nr:MULTISPECIES: NAD(P)-dependent oxidoreductase [Nitrosopumilus]AFS80012.1 NAD-dependent epimerase/dehydratase [Candidatus Nitrosopumilus koreensis AR1]
MNILVTGAGGYVGSNLIPELVKDGHFVKCLDRFFFGKDFLLSFQDTNQIELIQDDIRWFDPKILDDVDIVFDLAALSNDPVGELNPEKTFEINHLGRVRVATESKKHGVPRYILASSASVYGQQDNLANEDVEVFPITAYSKANHKAEIDVLKLSDEKFCVSVMRFASLYGFSPRMRFDISVNSMVLDLFKTGKIVVRGKNNKRPFLHVQDAVNAYKLILKADTASINGEIFNVGNEEQNYSIGQLAELIAQSVGIKYELELGDNNDHRSYAASFDKIRNTLGFKPEKNISFGANEIYEKLKAGQITDSTKTITLKWYQHIESDPELSKILKINGKLL